MIRIDNRQFNEIRTIKIIKNINKYAEGSVLIEIGETKIICTASVEDKVPPFLQGMNKGWLTAEYAMLPRANFKRNNRDILKGKINGRAQEIQRLIGRSLRAILDTKILGERTIWIDCDVIQADGGTRTASITGGYLALVLALQKLQEQGIITKIPIIEPLAAISVGLVKKQILLDLNYEEDRQAQVDMNLVITKSGKIIEIQGTAEKLSFNFSQLTDFYELGKKGILELIAKQEEILNF